MLGDEPELVPLIVDGDDVPWGMRRISSLEDRFVGRHILIPESSRIEIRTRRFPVFVRFEHTLLETFELSLFRHMEITLHDNCPLISEHLLEVVDVIISTIDDFLIEELEYRRYEDILVVRTIPDGDHSFFRSDLMESPEIVVLRFFPYWLLP